MAVLFEGVDTTKVARVPVVSRVKGDNGGKMGLLTFIGGEALSPVDSDGVTADPQSDPSVRVQLPQVFVVMWEPVELGRPGDLKLCSIEVVRKSYVLNGEDMLPNGVVLMRVEATKVPSSLNVVVQVANFNPDAVFSEADRADRAAARPNLGVPQLDLTPYLQPFEPKGIAQYGRENVGTYRFSFVCM